RDLDDILFPIHDQFRLIAVSRLDPPFNIVACFTHVAARCVTRPASTATSPNRKDGVVSRPHGSDGATCFNDPSEHFMADDEFVSPCGCFSAHSGGFFPVSAADTNPQNL